MESKDLRKGGIGAVKDLS